jgi:hypothetical protein
MSWCDNLPWERLRARVRLLSGLYSPVAASCLVCRGPVDPGRPRCFQCWRHRTAGPGLLADAVVPVSYAVRGSAFAGDLWRYKACHASDAAVRTSVLALSLVFLHDHGRCAWAATGMPAPDLLAVVPSGYGRPGVHPLLRLVAPYLRLPAVRLVLRPQQQGRELNANRFTVAGSVAGANVLLLDDTWVSGGSVQSAAVALKRAGAARVAAVVLGRHVNPGDPASAALLAAIGWPGGDDRTGYYPAKCAICDNQTII